MSPKVKTADDVEVSLFEEVFDYYSMKLCEIVTEPDDAGWFTVKHYEGGTEYLNGERICSVRHAVKMGWLKGPLKDHAYDLTTFGHHSECVVSPWWEGVIFSGKYATKW